MTFADLFLLGFLVHNVADWFFQSEWMALNKTNVYHPAGYVHAAIHFLFTALVWPIWAAIIVAVLHWLIDLRTGLAWWRSAFKQTNNPSNPFYLHVLLWQDQIAHWLVLAALAWKITGHF